MITSDSNYFLLQLKPSTISNAGVGVFTKAEKEMVGAKKVKLKNRRYAMKGKCKSCDTKMFRFVKK